MKTNVKTKNSEPELCPNLKTKQPAPSLQMRARLGDVGFANAASSNMEAGSKSSTVPWTLQRRIANVMNHDPGSSVQLMRRPDTILGDEQGDHTTAFSALWRAIRGVIDRVMGNGGTHQEAYEEALDFVDDLPGAQDEHFDYLTDEQRERYDEVRQQAIDYIDDVPDHAHQTRSSQNTVHRGMGFLEALANMNPLAATFRGGTGGREGHAINRLNRLEEVSDDEWDSEYEEDARDAVNILFDATNAGNAIELEDEAEFEDDYGAYLPGTLRDDDDEVDVDATRRALGDRHESVIGAAWSRIANFLGFGAISDETVDRLADGDPDDAYDSDDG